MANDNHEGEKFDLYSAVNKLSHQLCNNYLYNTNNKPDNCANNLYKPEFF